MNEITQRLETLRNQFSTHGIQALIIPSTDPHMSEYVASRWKSRRRVSGFTGSAGTVVIWSEGAGLWTDSRYFLQAEQELSGSGITLFREGLPQTPSIVSQLGQVLPPGSSVGIDPTVFSIAQAQGLEHELAAHRLQLKPISDPMDAVWSDRPSLPQNEIFVHEERYAGKSCTDKLAEIRSRMQASGTQALLVAALDEVAWTLNLRGSDVACNPVFVGYLLITWQKAVLFVEAGKLNAAATSYLHTHGVTTQPYDSIQTYLSCLPEESILLDPQKTNYAIVKALRPSCVPRYEASPVALLKAVRNEVETAGIREAMRRDGVALVRFLRWLETAVPSGQESELSIAERLRDFRAEHPMFVGESFSTIAGYGDHAAIVHYSATPDSNYLLQPKGFLLLDSGAQYPDGTTDITRTIALGPLTEEERTDYTLVLKGHIALSTARFPAGTRGAQLDVLARLPLWMNGMNYLHGTGHGVGHFLNVHEGPQSIRMNENPTVLLPGMVTSNEPGVYKSGSHGIRIENLVLTTPVQDGMFGPYLGFETLTLCPICTKGIRTELLSAEEKTWLNNYHQTVYDRLAPLLNTDEQAWLRTATTAI